jgi:serine/threonine-protein kinase
MTCPDCQSPNDEAAEVCFTCGKRLVAAPAAITRGTLVAERYEVLSPLGRGGMGVVYKAHDRVLDETVAVKVLRADVAREPEGARRFRSEIKLARNIRHRNVCAIHEYGESGGLRFIAMELVDGVDLRRQIQQQGALPGHEAFEVAIQAADGLQAIHKAGIIHRDLKTANIMRDTGGRVRVMDFGIAKRFGTDSTLAGRVVGTPEYMSPEQARGHRLDFRSDIYALGVVIYEIFTGRVPFQGDTPIATILMHINEAPTWEPPGAPPLPAALVPVLRQALAKTPDDRFATAGALAEALASARDTSASVSTPSRAPDPAAVPSGVSREGPAEARATPGSPRGLVARPWLLAAAGLAVALALVLYSTRRRALPDVSVVPPSAAPLAPSPTPAAGDVPRGVSGPGHEPLPPVPAASSSTATAAVVSPPARARASPTAAVARPGASPTAPSSVPAPTPAATVSAAVSLPTEPPPPPPSPVVIAQPRSPAPAAPSTTRPGDIVEAGPRVTPPVLVRAAEPDYPALAKRMRRPARVVIRALVDENGKVVSAQVAEGDPSRLGFDEAALQAAYKMVYKPATKDGVPVKMWIELPVTFRP